MGVSVSRSAAEINLDELERRLCGASTEPESADDALIELARRLAPLHSSSYPQAVSEPGRTDTELTTQPLQTAKLPPSNSEASGAPSGTAFVDVEAKQAFEFEELILVRCEAGTFRRLETQGFGAGAGRPGDYRRGFRAQGRRP